MKAKTIIKLSLILLAVSLAYNSKAQTKLLSGLDEGTYNQLALDIRNVSSLPIEVLISGGSLDNYQKLIAENDINITFMQYDVLLTNELLNPKIKEEIKVLFPLFMDEEIHLIARNTGEINSLKDLAGKKVAIGKSLQGTSVTAKWIKKTTGINWIDVEIGFNESFEALNKKEIDAFFYVGGAPAPILDNLALGADNIKLVPIKHKKLEGVYSYKRIEAFTYDWLNYNVPTYAVTTLLVINVKNNKDITIDIVKQLYEDIQQNMEKLQKEGHPKWKYIHKESEEFNIDWPYFYVPEKEVNDNEVEE